MPSTLMRPSQIAKIPYPFLITSIFKSDVNEVNVNNTTTETPLQNYTIPAGSLGPNDQVDFFFALLLSNNSAASVNYTLRVKFGGIVLMTDGPIALINGSNNVPWYFYGNIVNRGRADFQFSTVTRLEGAAGATIENSTIFAVDTSSAIVFQLTTQMGTAVATASTISNTAIVTVKPGLQ